MFGFWMFFIHHLYTAILVSIEEENGVMESIFSGYKFVPEYELREAIAEEADENPAPQLKGVRTSPVAGPTSQSRE
jgi:Ni/Fe-hydrogenase 1 B-type cytochrome subunit